MGFLLVRENYKNFGILEKQDKEKYSNICGVYQLHSFLEFLPLCT